MRISRLSWRLGFLVFLTAAAAALVWMAWLPRRSPRTMRTSPARRMHNRREAMALNRPGGGLAPAEAYEVYSALYQAPMNEPLAFAENSWTDIPRVGESCLNPANPEQREMADAFVAANRQSHRWEQKFFIPQGYRLLSTGEVSQARSCLSPAGRNTSQCASYKQLRYVRLLGVPGFDHARTRALVSVVKSCGGFCGSGGIFEVDKVGATWRRSVTTGFTRNCSWIY